jgi:hypothetical protein
MITGGDSVADGPVIDAPIGDEVASRSKITQHNRIVVHQIE